MGRRRRRLSSAAAAAAAAGPPAAAATLLNARTSLLGGVAIFSDLQYVGTRGAKFQLRFEAPDLQLAVALPEPFVTVSCDTELPNRRGSSRTVLHLLSAACTAPARTVPARTAPHRTVSHNLALSCACHYRMTARECFFPFFFLCVSFSIH